MPAFTGSSARAGSTANASIVPAARIARHRIDPSEFPCRISSPPCFVVFLCIFLLSSAPELQPGRFAVPQRVPVLLCPCLELVFLDLLAGGLGQRIGEMDEARHHEMRHVLV